jgi:hypothetical protein
MIDRYLVAYRLIESSLRRHGLPVTHDEVFLCLDKLPLPDMTKLAILMAPLAPDPDEDAIQRVRHEWRTYSLASNPFA